MKDLYVENCKTLLKKLKESEMESYSMFIVSVNIVKMFILPKVIHRFNAIAIKIPRIFLQKLKS